MESGKILVAEHDGAYVLKLIGDVRLTLCSTIDQFFEQMLSDSEFASVLVDLTEADNIDSTTLGQLAKLALHARQLHDLKPLILSTNPDITRILDSMSFDQVFEIRLTPLQSDEDLAELSVIAESEESVRDKVLEAHRVLMGLSDDNRAKFSYLVDALESSC